MQSRTLSTLHRQRGYSLMEILVAVAIFAVVMIVALLLYDQSNRVFKRANESAEMQQNTRVAFEKVVADLRMAGFDYKRAGTPTGGVPQKWVKDTDYSVGTMVTPDPPNGHVYRATKAGTSGAVPPGWTTGTGDLIPDNGMEWQEAGAPVYEQPDEQIEFAHDKAITIRANFDYEDPTTTDHGRETELEATSEYRFPIVTTNNDEIVTYALVSRSGNADSNKDKVTFYADVHLDDSGDKPARLGYPGGEKEKLITIDGVDLTNKYPPYTLMRYTLNDKGEPVGTALADNIRSMEFKYWQDSAAKSVLTDFDDNPIADFTTLGGLGQYDPAAASAMVKERLIRGKVRAVTATIVGMSPQPDYDYTSPSDTVASNYRQYTLQSTIVGRNLGLKGVPQTDSNPPGPPTLTNVCTGYCGVALLTWAPAPGTGDVTYTVLYDTSAAGSFSGAIPVGNQTSFSVDLTQFDMTKTYYFRVSATNEAGTTVSEGNPLSVNVRNVTQPNAPVINSVTSGLPNAIEMVFTPAAGNAAGAPTCLSGAAPVNTVAAEIRGYRIYRSRNESFDPTDGTDDEDLVLGENNSGLSSAGGSSFKFTDRNVANCVKYYYRVQAVEWCAAKAEYNVSNNISSAMSAVSGASDAAMSDNADVKPKTPTNLKQHVESVCDPAANTCNPVTLLWDKVIRDVNETPIEVLEYRITRKQMLNGTDVTAEQDVFTITDGANTYTDTSSLQHHVPLFDNLKYTYEYKVYAKNCDDEGDPATLVYPGTCVTGAEFFWEADGDGNGTADAPLKGLNSIGVKPYFNKPFKAVNVKVDNEAYVQVDDPYTVDWTIQDGEIHTISFQITTEDCTEVLMMYVQADAADCAIRTAVSEVRDVTTQLKVVLANISENDVMMETFDISWLGAGGTVNWINARLPSSATQNATATNPDTLASPRTVTFTPGNDTDRLIKAGDTYEILLNFSGAVSPSTVSALSSDYTEVSVNTEFGCGTQLVSCAVSASVPAAIKDTTTMYVDIKNNSTEEMSLESFRITWAGQKDWAWAGVTAGTTITITPVAGPTTQTFTPTGAVIGPGDIYRVTMNMTYTKPGKATDLDSTTVGTVYVDYTTPTSVNGVLTCKAK